MKSHSKEDWLKRIERDLGEDTRGIGLDVGLQEKISPFIHPSDLAQDEVELERKPWQIAAIIRNSTTIEEDLAKAEQLGADRVYTADNVANGTKLSAIQPNTMAEGFLMPLMANPTDELALAVNHLQGAADRQGDYLIAMTLDDRFLNNVAKLRALRILIRHVLGADHEVKIAGYSGPSQHSDIHWLIPRTAQLLAAACAADVLLTGIDSHYDLLAQQILRLEGSIGDISDPAAGSYYLETLTNRLTAETLSTLKSQSA